MAMIEAGRQVLILKRAWASRPSGEWNDDDFDVLEDGVVYHTYSAYSRGVDALWGMYQWLDRAPKGRNETGFWWRHHDMYGKRS